MFEYRKTPGNYGVWSVTLYNEKLNKNLLSLLEKLKARYKSEADKYKIAAALVLWRDRPLDKILSYMDEHHAKLALEILTESDSPFSAAPMGSDGRAIKVSLKRWGMLKLKGRETKVFSEGEDIKAREALRNCAYEAARGGYITNKEARGVLGLSDSKSEQVQVSRMFRSWMKEDFAEKGKKRGLWRIKAKFDENHPSVLEYLRHYSIDSKSRGK